jgi:hypothetical protein
MTNDSGEAGTVRLLHWNVHSWQDPRDGASNVGAVVGLIQPVLVDVPQPGGVARRAGSDPQ